MSGFNLSPGITPLLTDLFVLEFPIAIGLAYALRGGKGVEVVVALNAIALGLVKIVTDYFDIPDLIVGLAGLAGGGSILLAQADPGRIWTPPDLLWGVLGIVILVVGLIKVLRDFYDPFDLLLSDTCVIAGAWLLAGTVSRPGSRARPRNRVDSGSSS